jgi:hypothetical protein
VLAYTYQTRNINLKFTRNLKAKPVELYVDSDWASDSIDRRSVSGGLIYIYGNPATWYPEKQKIVALSSSEAEYKGLTDGFKEASYFRNLMQVELGIQITPITTRIDNMGAGFMAEQSITNKRTKHIDICYHYNREQIQELKHFELEYVPTKDNTSDIFTKALDRGLFEKHRNTLLQSREA